MADVSKIKLPDGTTYNIKDDNALPLTGGSVTGPVSFGDSISIDEATVGDLVVNGSANFTNNLQANTINGVAVGSDPKFTDTNTITTATTTGSGNAVTAVTASNGALTITKGTTFLTSHLTGFGAIDVSDNKIALELIEAELSERQSIIGISHGSYQNISCLCIVADDGSVDGNYIFIPDLVGVNTAAQSIISSIPTKTSELTNDSGFLTSAPVTSVNGQTGAVTINVPTATSELTNDGDGSDGTSYVTSGTLAAYITDDDLAIPHFYACDSTTSAVLQQAFGVSASVCVPEGIISTALLLLLLEPRTWFAWMHGAELEFARLSISVNTGTSAVTLYLRGRTSIATGIMGVDSSWTVTDILPVYDGGVS